LVIGVIGHFNYITICLLLQVNLTSFPLAAFSISWSNRLYQLCKVCKKPAFGLHYQIDQTINLTPVSNISCIEDSILQFSINLSNWLFLSFTCCNLHVNLLKCQLDQQFTSGWLNLSFILIQCQFDFYFVTQVRPPAF
jgi:hypothetical protein